jgi:hypothetical protein
MFQPNAGDLPSTVTLASNALRSADACRRAISRCVTIGAYGIANVWNVHARTLAWRRAPGSTGPRAIRVVEPADADIAELALGEAGLEGIGAPSTGAVAQGGELQ